jgi:hypothetical protein
MTEQDQKRLNDEFLDAIEAVLSHCWQGQALKLPGCQKSHSITPCDQGVPLTCCIFQQEQK